MSLGHGASVVREGLVLHLDAASMKSYPGSGTTWSDLSGNGNNGTLVNGVGYSSENNGTFTFDGLDDYAVSTGGYHNNISLTISLWFKPTNTISGGSNQVGRLWGTGGDLECRFDGGGTAINGRLACDIGGTNNLTSVSDNWLNTNWYNLTIRFNSSLNSSQMYIQGELDSSGTCGNFSTQSSPIQIGRSASGFGSPFPGKISSFLIYNQVLTELEIKQNFEATRGRYGI